jgi:enoyl-CoA hydratase/carnithine racemase
MVEGSLQGRAVRVALTDRAQAGGAFGVQEAAALQAVLESSAADRTAVVLVLDSAGARLDQGLPALGAFRRLFAAALKVRLAGVATVAVVARDCFGGASMLAALCHRRLALYGARFGLSGPAIVEALGGKSELDASDRQAVATLFGASARLRAGVFHLLCEDSAAALRAALASAVAEAAASPDLRAQHENLRRRLVAAGEAIPDARAGWRGFDHGTSVSALECWQGADALLTIDAPRPVELMLDAPGHAATRLDESLALSEYVTHLSLCLARHASRGGAVRLILTGEAAGAVYVALAAPAGRVVACATAAVRLLQPGAVATVLGVPSADEGLSQALLAGVIDEIAGT